MPERHLQRAAAAAHDGPPVRPALALPLGAGARGHGRRARRLHDEPRRGLAVPGPRPQPGAGRHDRAAAVHPGAGRRTRRRPGRHVLRSAAPTRRTCAPTAGAVDSSRAAEFLLLDRLFPRSVFAALEQRRGRAWPSWSGPRAERHRVGVADEARRIVGRARTELEFMRTDEILARAAGPARRAAADLLAGQRGGHQPLLPEQAPQTGCRRAWGDGRAPVAVPEPDRARRGCPATAGGCRSSTAPGSATAGRCARPTTRPG